MRIITPSFVNLGDNWPSDEKEVSKPETSLSTAMSDFENKIKVERETFSKTRIIPYCENFDYTLTEAKFTKALEDCPHPPC